MMETPTNENLERPIISSNAVDYNNDDSVSNLSNHGGMESIRKVVEIAEEQTRGILEVIASTGKFWHEWDTLKSMMSFCLKQVLAEYPEAKMIHDDQNSLLGETYPELVKRLDDALLSFIEGPPFTLQRICEILLTARSIYPKLSKLALALEKNLLVTSTLTISTDPYPYVEAVQTLTESVKEIEPPLLESNLVENGAEPLVRDGDEIMAEVEAADVNENMTIEVETVESIVAPSEAISTPSNNSQPSV